MLIGFAILIRDVRDRVEIWPAGSLKVSMVLQICYGSLDQEGKGAEGGNQSRS